jgi:methyl-accepting chemotaxis protein
MRRLSIGAKLAAGFAFGFAILIVVGATAYINTNKLMDTREWVSHTHEVLQATTQFQADLAEAVVGVRGFVVLGDEASVATYRAADEAATKDLNLVSELTADNPRQRARIQALRPLLEKADQTFTGTIDITRAKGFEAGRDLLRGGGTEKIEGDIGALLVDMTNEEKMLLQQRDADADHAARITFDTILYVPAAGAILLAAFGIMLARSITGPVRRTVDGLAAMTAEILAGTTQQASGVQEQAAAVAQTVTTVDEIVQTSEQASERVKVVAESSRRAVEVSTAGRQAVEESVKVMGAVKDQAESIAESILGLAEQAQAIGEITAAVNDIAEQTNLLALNAAIEASRAGEHGRGFSVVATEIKSLADQSKKATTQVRQILSDIQKATNSAVMATEEGTKSVNEAIRTVNQAGSTINSLSDTIADSARAAAQITASVGQQTAGMAQIQQAMQNINQATNQNLASTKQAERAAQELNALGISLRDLLAVKAA